MFRHMVHVLVVKNLSFLSTLLRATFLLQLFDLFIVKLLIGFLSYIFIGSSSCIGVYQKCFWILVLHILSLYYACHFLFILFILKIYLNCWFKFFLQNDKELANEYPFWQQAEPRFALGKFALGDIGVSFLEQLQFIMRKIGNALGLMRILQTGSSRHCCNISRYKFKIFSLSVICLIYTPHNQFYLTVDSPMTWALRRVIWNLVLTVKFLLLEGWLIRQ